MLIYLDISIKMFIFVTELIKVYMARTFKDGDIITNRHNGNICIYKVVIDSEGNVFYGMKIRYVAKTQSMDCDVSYLPICFQDYRKATEEEMKIFANAMGKHIEQDYWETQS